MSIRECSICHQTIPSIRIEILPNTQTCAECSTTEKVVGFMDWSHKTAPELVILNPENKESIRRAERINKRSR